MIQPSLQLQFAKVKALDPRLTFTRASTGTYFDEDGVLRTAAAGVPRFQHEPVTGESLGLLIEESRTNLLTYSEEFDNAAWYKVRSSITANATVAPDGTTTADKQVEDTSTSSTHAMSRTSAIAITANTPHTASIFVKAGERSQGRLLLVNSSYVNQCFLDYDLNTLTLSSGVVGAAVVSNFGIVPVGNGWFRVRLTGIVDTTSTLANIQHNVRAAGTHVYTGDGTSGIYIWGAQLEAGDFSSSYIPATSASVTRATDSCDLLDVSWLNIAEGTFRTESATSDSVAGYNYSVCNTASASKTLVATRVNTANIRFDILGSQTTDVAGAAIANISGGLNGTDPVDYPMGMKGGFQAISWEGSASALVSNAAENTITADGAAVIYPYADRLIIGNNGNYNGHLNGCLKSLTYWPQRLDNTTLQQLTA